MSTETQLPVYETVCVKTEERLVGFRDQTTAEQLAEEAFTSGVPTTYGTVQEVLTGLKPPLVVGGTLAPPVLPLPPGDVRTALETAAPAAWFLMAGALFAGYAIKRRRRKA